MLEWWEELVAIPNVEDYRKLAQKIHASFEIPRVRCEALKVTNDYSTPPAPKCVERKLFLPALDPRLPWQDCCKKQPQKTLAYNQANLPHPGEMCCLVRCVQELRCTMKPFTSFSDHAILEKAKPDCEAPKAEVEGPTQPSTTLTKQIPLPDTRPSTPPAVPADEPAIPTTPLAVPASEWAVPTIQPAMLTNEPAVPTAPPVTTNNQKGTKDHEYPNWTKIHPSHPVASVGHVPLSLGDLRQHCHSHHSSRRRAWCCWIKEQLSSDQGDYSPASSRGSLRQEYQMVEDLDPETSGAQTKTLPPGFKEIAESLMGDDPSGTMASVPPVSASAGFWQGLPWPLWCPQRYTNTKWLVTSIWAQWWPPWGW